MGRRAHNHREMDVLVPKADILAFVQRVMAKAGANQTEAACLGDALVNADYRSHFSHGLNRLEFYYNDMKAGAISTSTHSKCSILNETPATAWVDGGNLLGSSVAEFCMKTAIEKAKVAGIGMVSAKMTNHFSICGHWALMAEKEGMIDMATTTVALGKVEVERRKGNQIPSGWAVNNKGEPTTNPDECWNGGGLMPLGGMEQTGGYKGFGLGMMVDILCGVLAGSNYANQVRRWGFAKDASSPANLGQCFIVIDPGCFAPGFEGRMDDLHRIHRELDTAPDSPGPVQVPGDPEREHMKKCDELDGIPYPRKVIEHFNKFADEIGTELLVHL